MVLESSFGWGWICQALVAAELDPHLANSRKVAAWREARGIAKSNRTDADLLSELPSEKTSWWEVWLAPPKVRDQREWLRYRMSLVAILHRHGIVHEFSDLFGRDGWAFLELLIAAKQTTLRASAKAMLVVYGRCRL